MSATWHDDSIPRTCCVRDILVEWAATPRVFNGAVVKRTCFWSSTTHLPQENRKMALKGILKFLAFSSSVLLVSAGQIPKINGTYGGVASYAPAGIVRELNERAPVVGKLRYIKNSGVCGMPFHDYLVLPVPIAHGNRDDARGAPGFRLR